MSEAYGKVGAVYEHDGGVVILVDDEFTDRTPYRVDLSPDEAFKLASDIMRPATIADAPHRCCCEDCG